MFEFKYIENPPTIHELASLYFSETYQNLLKEFDECSRHKLDSRPEDDLRLYKSLRFLQHLYKVLNISFEEVVSAFEQQKEKLLQFTIRSIDFYAKLEEELENEPDEGEKIGVGRTFMLDKFCEIYLLNLGDYDRLLHYLETTRMPDAVNYMKRIIILYNDFVE